MSEHQYYDQKQSPPKLPGVVIPWWQDGSTTSEEIKEPHFLSKGVFVFFQMVWSWLLFPLRQMDALTCSEKTLELMAWDRDIKRFEGEPLSLFRKRVKYAAVNAKDAGSVAGFKRIFERLGIGIVTFKEREQEAQWDVCTIELTDDDIANNNKLAQTLIEQYGRTCRRYRFEVTYPAILTIASGELAHNFSLFLAGTQQAVDMNVKPQPVEHRQQVFIANF
ncbi:MULTISPECIES: phage tail protein [Vibrio]|uniref:Phage tail protein n=1 Tax=Vibrio tasmaniensis TaxID=212663 RepID=A0A2N7NH19_9VIBR|nr:phage tail protein [Vibrio tasmaniensis]PMP13749.1 phage tail protein [Vibrio tasmaniensis]TKG28483.1 phage tail protein [Vibrio tasmaniensis]TKG39085.1 phage tail protein [Vibrio tasmaniensis]TKG42315.1 phage tail protein [Vibrio tasmaniensis]TKG54919.1 phage tail protein [Vibrio tasmaniensis]